MVGQHWEFEQVDTAPWGRSWIELEFDRDGRCFVAYGDQGPQAVRVAWKDSVWRYRDTITPNQGYDNSFAVSRTGKWGIAYADTTMHATLLEWRGSSWVCRTTAYEIVFGSVPVAYDSLGNAMLLCNTSLGGYGVVRVTLGDTWEAVDTVLWNPSPYWDYGPVDIEVGPDRGVWALVQGGYSFPGAGPGGSPPWDSELYLMYAGPDSWEREWLGGGMYVEIWATALAAGLARAATCHGESGGSGPEFPSRFICDGDSLDTLAWAAGLAVDGVGRLCLAYTRLGELSFMYRDSLGWHRRLVTTTTDRGSRVDVEIDTLGQPVVAFSTLDGVWIARGVDVLGTTGPESVQVIPSRWPTISSGLLMLSSREDDAGLLDIVGRKVMDLRPGPNDTRHLAPGVYFVREEGPRGQVSEGSSVRKIVIQR